MRVEVIRDDSGNILAARNDAELKKRPWCEGDLRSFRRTVEDWTAAEWREYVLPAKIEAFRAEQLREATLADLREEARVRGYDLTPIIQRLDGGM